MQHQKLGISAYAPTTCINKAALLWGHWHQGYEYWKCSVQYMYSLYQFSLNVSSGWPLWYLQPSENLGNSVECPRRKYTSKE